MRKRAEAATAATPWNAEVRTLRDGRTMGRIRIASDGGRRQGRPRQWLSHIEIPGTDAEHIASWHPAVALAVADWLDRSAETYERLEDDLRGLEGAPTIEQVYGYDFTEAIAVARAFLGADA